MSRWAVRQNLLRDGWGVYRVSPDGVSGVLWERISPWFDTWREAMDHADRKARTREYVLPRPDERGYIATTDKQTSMEGTILEHAARTAAWIEDPGTIGVVIGDGDYYMTPDGARSLGLALLALAEKERA